MTFTYDDIYGIGIEEYLERHNQTLDELIVKNEIDMEILKENLHKVLNAKLPYPESYLETEVYKSIQKKTKHLNRLKMWAAEGKDWD